MSALWVFVPVLGAPIVHAPILRSDLLPGLKRPLDGGLELRGRRVFGANKTLRGLLAMVGGVAPGTQRRSPAGALISIYDQGDFVPVVWLLLLPIWAMPVEQAAIAFVVVSAIHALINLIGYAQGVRRTPI